jgi:MFS family permease
MKYFLFTLFCVSFKCIIAQTDSIIQHFDERKNRLNHNGMIVLTSWAGANIAGSAVGYALTNSYEEKQFYIMNGAWGVINLGIALPGLLSKQKPAISIYDIQKNQTKLEKIFLANAILDIVYITGGFYLKEYGSHQEDIKKKQMYNGFGNSVILQGAGLMAFDVAMTLLNNRNRNRHLDPFLKKASISFSGNFVKLGYKFN